MGTLANHDHDRKHPAGGDLAVGVILMAAKVSDAHTRAALALSGLTRHRWQRIALNRQRALERLVWRLADTRPYRNRTGAGWWA